MANSAIFSDKSKLEIDKINKQQITDSTIDHLGFYLIIRLNKLQITIDHLNLHYAN